MSLWDVGNHVSVSQNTKPPRGRMPGWHRLWTGSRLPALLYGLHARALRLAPPVSIGVRMLVADDRGRVLLIRHTYRPGWYLPGGGVKRWESLRDAAVREAREEAGIAVVEVAGPPSMHANFVPERSDHVALFTAARWQPIPDAAPSAEIAEARFFPAADPPAGTTASTRRRLAEWVSGAAPSERW